MSNFFSGPQSKNQITESNRLNQNFEHFITVNDQMNETSKNIITKFCNQLQQQQQQQLRQIICPSNYFILKQFNLFSSYFFGSFLLQCFFFFLFAPCHRTTHTNFIYYFIYSSSLASSIRLCGHTVKLGKLVFQKNLFRSIDIIIGDVWNRLQVR